MAAITVVTDEVRQRMIDELTTPGGLYEVTKEDIRGIKYKFFKSRPKNLREMYALGIEKESFYAKVMIHWFGDLDFPALVYQDEHYSYKEIVKLAARLAWRMKQQYGIEKGEQVATVIMVRPGEQLTEQELKDFLVSRLAKFKIPSIIWIQKNPLPRGATDKIYKKGIREEKLKEIGGPN